MGIVVALSDCAAQTCEQLAQELIRDEGGRKGVVWLSSDSERVLDRRKVLSAASPLRLGCSVLSLAEWVDDRWELFGDGRAVVNSVQRKLLMRQVLAHAGTFSSTAGTVDALCQMVQQGFGVPAFVEAMDGIVPDGCALSDTEKCMVQVAEEYGRLLREHGLCERGEAMRLLATQERIVWPAVVCEGFTSLSRDEAVFFAALSQRVQVFFVAETALGSRFDAGEALASALQAVDAQVERMDYRDCAACAVDADELGQLAAALYYPDPLKPVQAQGAVRALLPAGRYAAPALLADCLRATEGTVLVSCNDPAAVFEELAARLSPQGVSVEACYTRPFADTDFGAAFLNCTEILNGGEPGGRELNTFQATDFALSVLTDMRLFTSYYYDAKWRGNRLTNREGVLDDLCDRAPEVAAPFVGSLENDRLDEAFQVAEARYRALGGVGEAFRAEQLAAVHCARRIFEQADQLGSPLGDVLPLLERANVTVRIAAQSGADAQTGFVGLAQADGVASVRAGGATAGNPHTHVLVLSQDRAAQSQPLSFDCVVVCNLNSSEQSLKENRTSVDELFAHLGIEVSRSLLFEARARMLRLVRAARKQLVLARALHNEEADPAYPAVVFEDVTDCYRTRHADASELDKATSLPPSLLPYAVQRGEELLLENLSSRCESCLHVLPVGSSDKVSPEVRSLVMPSRLSASAIEEYLDCPHKWFASRRLRLNELDASFSAREKGSFIHSVLKCFYERFKEEYGFAKPAPDMLPQAEALLERVFEDQLAQQPTVRIEENPLIPLTETERRQVDAMLLHLKGFLVRDARFLSGFSPRHFEFSFGKETPFEYAGISLVGSIDRVDVDAEGRAVVVDYKSSLSSRYCLLPANAVGFELPAKVQTLIYAQVVRRVLGLDVVGALYVNTQNPGSAQPKACGAYSDFLLGPEDVLGASAKRNALSQAGFATFNDLLDETERLIADRLAALAAGDVSVRPGSKESCTFCPVLSCEGRL